MSSHRCAAEDDAAIRNLIGLTALLGDTGDPEDYRRVYAPSASWQMGAVAHKGADEIVAGAAVRRGAGTSGPGTGTRHVVIPAVIEVDGDTATAVSHFVFLAGFEIRNAGTYRDTLIRTENGWQISVRTVSLPLARARTEPDLIARWLMPGDFKLEVGRTFTFRGIPMPAATRCSSA